MKFTTFYLFILFTALIGCGQDKGIVERLEVASNGIHGGAISHDGMTAVLGSVFHGGSLWRLTDGERLYNWNHSDEEQSIIISADIDATGEWALTAEAHTMVLWAANTGDAARFWTAPGEVLDLALAPGGRFALLGLADHSAVIFNTIQGGIARTFTHQGRVRSVDITQDGRLAITGSEDQTAIIWRVDRAEALMTIQHQEDVQLVAISPNGDYAFTAAKYDKAEIWDVNAKRSLKTLPLAKEKLKRGLQITSARFNQNGSQLLVGYSNRTVELWNVKNVTMVKQWKLSLRNPWQPTGVSALDLSFTDKKGRYLAMGTNGFVYYLE